MITKACLALRYASILYCVLGTVPGALSGGMGVSSAMAAQDKEQLLSKASQALDAWSGQAEVLSNARAILEEILKFDPSFAPAHYQLARYYLKEGYAGSRNGIDHYRPDSIQNADKEILNTLQLDPKYADAFVLRASIFMSLGKLPLARSSLEAARRLKTNSPWLDLELADLLSLENKPEQAIRVYENIITKGTSNKRVLGSAYERLANLYLIMGDIDKSDKMRQADIALDPGDAWAHGNYANFLLFKRGDFDGAIREASAALRIMPYPMAQSILAAALYMKWAHLLIDEKRPEEAQKYYVAAYELYPDRHQMLNIVNKCPQGALAVVAFRSIGVE